MPGQCEDAVVRTMGAGAPFKGNRFDDASDVPDVAKNVADLSFRQIDGGLECVDRFFEQVGA